MTSIHDQHFLIDEKVIQQMIKHAQISESDTVIDIGAGHGEITKQIPSCKKIIAVENDSVLAKELRSISNIEVIEANALDIKLNANKLISNLPFSIAEPFMYHLFRSEVECAVLLVPRAFAANIQLGESVLSILCKAFFTVEQKEEVEPVALEPVPDTALCIIVLQKKNAETAADFFVQQLFLQRDKKAKNALTEAFVQWKVATKKTAKEFVLALELPAALLNTNIPQLNAEGYQKIMKAVQGA